MGGVNKQILGGIVGLGMFLVLIGMLIRATIRGSITGPVLTAISTLLLVIVTAGYAFLTYRLVSETKRSREQEIRPVLEFHAAEYGSFIRNVGTGPARNVEATLTMLPKGATHNVGIQYLPAGDEVGVYVNPFADLQDREFMDLQISGVPVEDLPRGPEEEADFWDNYGLPYERIEMDWSCVDVWGNSRGEINEYKVWPLMEETGGYEERDIDEAFSLHQISTELRAIRALMERQWE